MNIVIVAGGLGTRFGSLSVFPKILLPTNKYNSILNEDLSVFPKLDAVYLIVNEKYYKMTENYLKVNKLDIWGNRVKLICSNNTNGSYNTLKSVERELPNLDTLYIWSDIVLDKIPEFDKKKYVSVFTYSNGQKYRYKLENGKISLTDKYDGNIPGVYYIRDHYSSHVFDTKLNEYSNYDLVDAIKDSGVEITEVKLNNLFEYRDYETYLNKLKEYQEYNLKTRFFNELKIDKEKNILTKRAVVEDYYPIIEKEYNWYDYGKMYGNTHGEFNSVVPKTFDYTDHSFNMEYLDGYLPLHKVLKMDSMNISKVNKIYSNIKSSIEKIGFQTKNVDKDLVFNLDLRKEVIDKVIARCDKIKDMLISYDKEYMISLLNKAFKYLFKLEKKDDVIYQFGHGDLNGSNVLVNPDTLDVKFVDPRGYFGNSNLFIWPKYEYAKLLYCLYGYDDFNNLPQIYGIDKPKKLCWVNTVSFLHKKEYRILVGVIYVALAGYISQDIMKANIAYEYGIEILENELSV